MQFFHYFECSPYMTSWYSAEFHVTNVIGLSDQA